MKIEIIGKEYECRELYKNSFHVLHFYRRNFRKNCKELYSVQRFLRILIIFAKVIWASMKGLNLLNVVESRYEPRIYTMYRNGNFGLVFGRGEILLTYTIFVYHWTS